MTKGYFLFAIFSLLLFVHLISCTKEKNVEQLISVGNEDTSYFYKNNPDTIIMGKYYNNPVSFEIDVDKDGINDFKLSSNIHHAVCIYTYNEAIISCLNKESYIYTGHTIDTTFINTQIDTLYDFSAAKTEIFIGKTYGCERMDEKDSVGQIKEMRFVATVNKNDKIAIDDNNWISDTLNLSKENYTILYADYISIPTWYMREDHYYKFDCNLFFNNQIVYVGIKKVVGGIAKLGWIKLSVIDNYIITIFEVAIQK